MNKSLFWDNALKKYVREYYENPDTFLRQPTISYTTHPNCVNLADSYYKSLISDSFFKNIVPTLSNEIIGQPYKLKNLDNCSLLTIIQLYQIKVMRDQFGIFIPKEINSIVEIGGGYGNFRRIMHDLNYIGDFTIVDFEEMLDIQKDYLEKNNILNTNFKTLNHLENKTIDSSLLIASFSVSEMLMEERKQIENIYKNFNYIFITHNKKFESIDNRQYFSNLQNMLERDFDIIYFQDSFRLTQCAWFMLCKRK